MPTQLIQPDRIQTLNNRPVRDGRYVLYWMQQSQRAEANHALEYAVRRANELDLGLLVVFGLTDDDPEANLRHYRFMLEGLQDAQRSLARRSIRMVVRRGRPADVAIHAGRDAALIICDRGYLRRQKSWREQLAEEADCEVVQVESDVVAPVEVVSDKHEYAARTIRPKIHKHLDRFLVDLRPTPLKKDSMHLPADGLDLSNLDALLDKMQLDRSVPAVPEFFTGGATKARRIFPRVPSKAPAGVRRLPQSASHQLRLGYGDVSALRPGLAGVSGEADRRSPRQAASRPRVLSYIEELVVRRELSINFVHYVDDYDAWFCLPDWARKTLEDHADDPRDHVYTKRQFENAETHDEYWNAAMLEMKHTGYMHNYMRMYWGKKIIEWTRTPESAFRLMLELNNRYFLDGRDANSFANVAWCFGLHDRPWKQRPIFGKVRYMNAAGLERKTEPEAYVEKVRELVGRMDGR